MRTTLHHSKTPAFRLGTLAIAVGAFCNPALAAESSDERIEQLEQKVDALADALDRQSGGGKGDPTYVNGYGEIHYNKTEADAGGGELDRVDFHRFILEIGHNFNDDIRFYSELEFEHAVLEPELETETNQAGNVTSAELENEGELKLEQGYVEFDLSDTQRVQVGLFLMPVGIINETHEPPRFYGVERNQVESEVLPSTWAETGALLKGNLGDSGFSYDLGLHTGLDTPDGTIEEGVKLAAKQSADSLATTGRLKYTGVPGLELAGSVSLQGDLSQGTPADDADSATLVTGHAIYNVGGLKLTGLAANWTVDGNVSDAAEDQTGAYIEAAYKPIEQVGLFVRQSNIDIAVGGSNLDRDQTTIGANYWPHPDVVLKADVVQQDANDDTAAFDGFNLALGYQF